MKTPLPSKIVCVGRNYREHARELGHEVPAEPLLFLKPPSSVIASGDEIVIPPYTAQVEHEAEIGVIVGRRLQRASADEAWRAIGAVAAVNDVTARDLQRKDGQWTRAKGFDTFCPVGPASDRVPPLEELVVIARVNGEERQRGAATDMVFAIPELLSYISHIMTLEAGDLVATGTPAGVGPLSAGDMVEIEVVGLSIVRNPVTVLPVD